MLSPAEIGSAKLEFRLRHDRLSRQGPPGLTCIRESADGGLLYTPRTDAPGPPGLAVLFHGSRSEPAEVLQIARAHADRLGFMIAAPKSGLPSWDLIVSGRYGPDVAALDQTLSWLMDHHAFDPRRAAIGGFSDGASYALSLGLTNGELFAHIIAFSPGFSAPTGCAGRPAIMIAHGRDDPIIAVNCSRSIVSNLGEAGRDPAYREFSGGHVVPEPIARWAFDSAFAKRARPARG